MSMENEGQARCCSLEEEQSAKEKVISMYHKLESILKSDLRFELEIYNPDFLTVLHKRMEDRTKNDYGIVFAGDTSAGKSSLINTILGVKLLEDRNFETTSTIVKLRYSDRVRIITESDTGNIKEKDFTDKCDLESIDGVKVLRDYLKDMTDMNASQKSAQIRSVDIRFPTAFLKVLKAESSFNKKTVDICRIFIKGGVQCIQLSGAKATSRDLLLAPNSPNQDRKYSEAQFEPLLHYFYYKPAKLFPHFDYFYNLTRKCIERIGRMEKSEGQSKPLSKDVVIKIGIVGWFSENNLKLISKRIGKEKMPEDAQIWSVSPLLCFQNESSSKSALEVLRKSSACHKILIKSDEIYHDTKEADDTIIIIGQNKEQIKKSITICLEEPLHSMLEEWLEYLKKYGSSRKASRLISEIEAIREQMAFEGSRNAAVASDLPKMCAKSIIPEDVKNYLFGRSDVNSFGIWSNSSLKIFVKKTTNVTQLRDELLRINKMFFEEYDLEIEERKLIEKRTLRQGDSILPNLPDENGTYKAGTLGGFVTKTDDEGKIYALTCNHLFLDKNEANLAYADNSYGFREIGTCVFTTTDKSCDFAAIEIMDSFSDNCDVIFRREDEKKTNARIYTGSLHPRIVHKIGATTKVTTGIICSPEWYKKIHNEENREYIFLVEGIDEQFSEEGDSGALVFSRPKSMQQNYVDVLGMVYANDLIVYDDEDDQNSEKHDDSKSPCTGVEKKGADMVEKPKLNIFPFSHNDENKAAQNNREGKNISCCYRLYTALELFEENQGEHFAVKFKDDVSSSSRSSSPSSKSDDSNQDTFE